jgi:hypothetical protein
MMKEECGMESSFSFIPHFFFSLPLSFADDAYGFSAHDFFAVLVAAAPL